MSQYSHPQTRKVEKAIGSYYFDHNMIDHIYSDWEEFYVSKESENDQQHGCNLCSVFRYSSTNQREESIEAQVRACQEYAKRNGLIIVEIYADLAKTGTNAEREEFQRMIADSAAGKFEYVIVHKLDRFSRD